MLHQRTRPMPDAEPFPSTSQVANLLHISPKTIARWAKDRLLPHQRSFGGHRRDPEQAIRQLPASLAEGGWPLRARPPVSTALQPTGERGRMAYTVAEVAAMLGKHPNTIYEWVQRGALPAEKLGGTIYVPKWALARLLSPAADH